MKRFKKLALALALAGPMITNFSCMSSFVREARAEMIAAFGDAVNSTAATTFTGALGNFSLLGG